MLSLGKIMVESIFVEIWKDNEKEYSMSEIINRYIFIFYNK